MKKILCLVLGVLWCFYGTAQEYTPQPLEKLINTEDPGWPIIEKWIEESTNEVVVLPKDAARADAALYQAQVSTRSLMGAVVYETGGILVDHGWLRIIGSGCDRFDRSLMEWNQGKSFEEMGDAVSYLLIADDVIGGFFAVNAGGIATDHVGDVYYFAPNTYSWEHLGIRYADFLQFCFEGDLEKFYEGLRWKDWEVTIANVDGNEGVFCFPYLWTLEGSKIEEVSKTTVPVSELWDLYFADQN